MDLLPTAGVVQVTKQSGGTRTKTTCKKGSACGEQWILGEAPADESACTETACTLVTIPRSCLLMALRPVIEEQRRETALYLLEEVHLGPILELVSTFHIMSNFLWFRNVKSSPSLLPV